MNYKLHIYSPYIAKLERITSFYLFHLQGTEAVTRGMSVISIPRKDGWAIQNQIEHQIENLERSNVKLSISYTEYFKIKVRLEGYAYY